MSLSGDLRIKVFNSIDKPQVFSATDNNGTAIEIKLDKCSDLACLFECVRLVRYKGTLTVDPYEVENTLTYLTEKIKLVEEDKDKTILRGIPPMETTNHISYFEMDIRRYSMTFCRYVFDKALQTRSITLEPLTKPVIFRLMEDLVKLAGE
jgi:hypothetical protein